MNIFKKQSKYKNKKVKIDGITFASQIEAQRYIELKLLKQAGIIKDFELQPVFKLHAGIKYIADFKVIYPDGRVEFEDVKGVETPVFKLKMKLLKTDYPDVILRIIGKRRTKNLC